MAIVHTRTEAPDRIAIAVENPVAVSYRLRRAVPNIMMKRTLWLSVLFAVALLVGCKQQGGGDTIKIGEFASLSGSEASFGKSSHNGTLIAIDEIKASGGLLGKKVELIYEDDQSKDGESATAVKKLISRDKVVAISAKSHRAVRWKPRPFASNTRSRRFSFLDEPASHTDGRLYFPRLLRR